MPDPLRPTLPPGATSGGAWRERLDALAERVGVPTRRLVAGSVVVVVLVALVVVLIRPGRAGSAPPVDLPRVMSSAGGPAGQSSTSSTRPDAIVVDVAGAVARPGVHRMPFGSRTADAIAAAGGATADADLTRVNQARVLTDGEQVRVPRLGEPAPAAAGPVPSGGAASGSGDPASPVDLNAATAEQLDELPGVGPATAAAIVDWRNRNGPFRSVDDLLDVPGIGPAKLERIRPLVVV